MKRLRSRLVTVADVGFHAGGAGHGDEELGELIVAAALARPDVVGVVDLFEALRLLLCGGVFAGVAGVFELHDRGVDLAKLLIGRVGGSDDVFDGCVDGGTGADELVLSLCPVFAFVLPELLDGAIGGVIEENAIGEAADRRHEVFLGSGRDVMHVELDEGLSVGAGEAGLLNCAPAGRIGVQAMVLLAGRVSSVTIDVAVEVDRFPEVVAFAGPEIGLDVPVGRLADELSS